MRSQRAIPKDHASKTYGPDVTMPDLLRKIADCPKNDPLRGGCQVRHDFSDG
jgi:hypothetical protein